MSQQQQLQPDALVAKLLQLPYPPHQPLSGSEKGSFAYDTITTRLPAIMGTVLTDLDRLKGTAEFAKQPDWQQQVDVAAAAVRQIQQDMPADAQLLMLSVPEASTDSRLPLIVSWTNACLEAWMHHMSKVWGSDGLMRLIKPCNAIDSVAW